MARITYGDSFRTRRGRYGRYKYVNGRKVSFEATRSRSRKTKSYSYKGRRHTLYRHRDGSYRAKGY